MGMTCEGKSGGGPSCFSASPQSLFHTCHIRRFVWVRCVPAKTSPSSCLNSLRTGLHRVSLNQGLKRAESALDHFVDVRTFAGIGGSCSRSELAELGEYLLGVSQHGPVLSEGFCEWAMDFQLQLV